MTVPMVALRSWRNVEYEGFVPVGTEFDAASEDRAKELERLELAVRRGALSGKTVKVEVGNPPVAVELKAPARPLSARRVKARSKPVEQDKLC